MNTYMIGSTIRLGLAFSVNGTAATPGSVALTVRAPDGTSTSPTPTNDGNGAYHLDYTPTVAGVFHWYAVGSGFAGLPAGDAIATEAVFSVSISRTLTP